MTDEKKELPWPTVDCSACNGNGCTEQLVGYELDGTGVANQQGCDWCDTTGTVIIVPEPEAKQLFELRQKIEVERLNTSSIVHSLLIAEIRALQERVSKFDEASKFILSVLFDKVDVTYMAGYENDKVRKEFEASINLLREAMGEDR